MYIMSMYIIDAVRPGSRHTGGPVTETRVPQPPIGREVALAQRALSDLLNSYLAEVNTNFPGWFALSTLATEGSALPIGAFRRDLATRLRIDEASVAALVDGFQATGAVRLNGTGDGALLELTDEGAEFHGRLSDATQRNTAELLDTLVPEDVDTTIRVLRVLAERAESMRSRSRRTP
jgi:DNA-binding MarR family transcriptional regulator